MARSRLIVLDEQLRNSGVAEAVRNWYRGPVTDIRSLRPGTVIPDEAVPSLLRRVHYPTFLTINATDFWTRIAPDRHFCILCFPVSDLRTDTIPLLLRRLLRSPDSRSKARRAGKIARVTSAGAWYYRVGDPDSYFLPLPG